MTIRRSHLLTLILAVLFALGAMLVPALADTQAAEGTTGSITNGGTNFRSGPGKKYSSLMKLDRGTVVTITSIPDGIGEDYWYGVSYDDKKGYVNSEFVRLMTGGGAASVTVSPTATPKPSGSEDFTNAVQLVLTSCHLRTSPNGYYDRNNDWEGQGSILPLAGTARNANGYTWYPVLKDGQTYYVRNDCVKLVSSDSAEDTASSVVTPKPSESADSGNGVQLVLSSCHLRTSPNGYYDRNNDWEGQGSILPLAGSARKVNGYTWYPVLKDGQTYYVRNDCVKLVNSTTAGTVTTTTTTSSGSGYGYVQTIMGGCNLRSTMGGTVIKQVGKYQTYQVLSRPTTKGGYTWYYVNADGNKGYLRSDVVKVVSGGSTSTSTSSTGTSASVSTDSDATGYVKTTANAVNLRTKAGYTSIIGKVDKNVTMPYYSTTVINGVTWYYVRHATLGKCYIHGSYVSIVNSDGSATPTPQPTKAPSGTTVSSTTGQVEATYSTLRVGSTGTAVKRLVQALKDQGYFKGTVTNKYTTAVQSAVKAFQKAAKLTVDGIAGNATQHALYGTVPVGASEASKLTMTIYPAEKIDWWTGGIQNLWAKGANYKVYDVKTGVVWWAHRWSGGYHVDAEPLTAADTARLCSAYGVTTAQEIANKNLYERRPSLVTIGNRTFACSLYGVPHNYPEGDTISTNDFKGQLCIHFTNSWTHGSKKVDSLHTEAIQYALDNAPNGHK